jgi:hypothetical protein
MTIDGRMTDVLADAGGSTEHSTASAEMAARLDRLLEAKDGNGSGLPDNAKTIAEQIERLGFKWELRWDHPVQSPDEWQRVQVREVDHVAPASEVARYRQAMKRGDKFPPGVVTRDGVFVDFNTRAAAAHKLGWLTFPAFVINVQHENAIPADRARLRLLGAALNTKGAKPLSRSEISDIVRQVVTEDGDYTAEKVAQHLGVTAGMVRNILAQFRAEQRAERLGVPFNGTVSGTTRAILGQRSDKLMDGPYRDLVRLTQDAGLTGEELRTLCTAVEAATVSDDARRAVIAQEREQREGQIAHFLATGRSRPPLALELRSGVSRTRLCLEPHLLPGRTYLWEMIRTRQPDPAVQRQIAERLAACLGVHVVWDD